MVVEIEVETGVERACDKEKDEEEDKGGEEEVRRREETVQHELRATLLFVLFVEKTVNKRVTYLDYGARMVSAFHLIVDVHLSDRVIERKVRVRDLRRLLVYHHPQYSSSHRHRVLGSYRNPSSKSSWLYAAAEDWRQIAQRPVVVRCVVLVHDANTARTHAWSPSRPPVKLVHESHAQLSVALRGYVAGGGG